MCCVFLPLIMFLVCYFKNYHVGSGALSSILTGVRVRACVRVCIMCEGVPHPLCFLMGFSFNTNLMATLV